MPVSVICPTCSTRLKVPDTSVGRTVRCPACGASMLVPANAPRAAETPVAALHKRFPHLLHLILTIVTCGGWLPIYVLHYLLGGPSGRGCIMLLLVFSLVLNVALLGGFVAVGYTGAWARLPVPTLEQYRTYPVSVNNLKQIGAAMQKFQIAENGKLPAAASTDAKGQPLLSWRVHLLPYLGAQEAELYKEFHLDEPWDSEHNKKLIAKMPAVYRSGGAALAEQGKTTYLVPVGEKLLFRPDAEARENPRGVGEMGGAEIKDGMANTILVVDADDDRAVIWTKPDDLKVDANQPRAGLGGRYFARFLALFADGTVHLLPADIDRTTLNGLLTPDGHENVVPPPDVALVPFMR
jgi:hypothetical protein